MKLVVAVTGHRPDKLPGTYSEATFNRMVLVAKTQFIAEPPKRVNIGMALGFDQACAQACVDLDIPYIAAIPFKGQEMLWPAASRDRYTRLLAWAEKVEVIGERDKTPIPKLMQQRNEWMIDQCENVVALWDGSFGGTHNCLVYAKKKLRPITNLWEQFNGDGNTI